MKNKAPKQDYTVIVDFGTGWVEHNYSKKQTAIREMQNFRDKGVRYFTTDPRIAAWS